MTLNQEYIFKGRKECLHLSNTRVAQEVLQHFLYCIQNQNQQEMPAQFFLWLILNVLLAIAAQQNMFSCTCTVGHQNGMV